MKLGVILFLIFVIYAVFGAINFYEYGTPNASQDFTFHFERAVFGVVRDSDYPPFYHVLFSVPVIQTTFDFYLLNLFLIIILIPLVIYFWSKKNIWAILIYFFGVSLPHLLIYGATYPQALVLLFVLFYFWQREKSDALGKYMLFIVMAFLSAITHSQGFLLFLIIGSCEAINHFLKDKKMIALGYLNYARLDNLGTLTELFLFHLPAPIIYYGLKAKNSFYTLIAITGFVLGIVDFRASSITQLAFIFMSAGVIKNLDSKKKKALIVFFACMALFFIVNYGVAKINLLKQ